MSMSAQEHAAMSIVLAVGEAIKDLGSVPNGHLYARLMGQMNLETYNKVIALLVKVGAVKNENNLLTWVGK
jgi:hypothetical protein